MNEIPNVSQHLTSAPIHYPATVPGADHSDRRSPQTTEAGNVDRAEFSELGRLLSTSSQLPGASPEKIAALKVAIEEDPDRFINTRLEKAVEQLLEHLFGG